MFELPSKQQLLMRLLMLPVTILSLSVHEWAHAWSAFRLGDDTAAREGRLTLSPLAHIDPVGTILLPLCGIPFGWAKPVPVNPLRFRRDVAMRTGMMITAAAGPFSNLVLALACAVLAGLAVRFQLHPLLSGAGAEMLETMIVLNIGLCLFNLLPIPPLDGSRIAEKFLPYSLRPHWEQLTRFGGFLLLIFVFYGRGLLTRPVIAVYGQLTHLTSLIAGY